MRRKIQFGAGPYALAGWSNHDLDVDIAKPLPMENEAADVIFSEMTLEHVSHREAWNFLEECYRILRRGGLIRITIPDFVRNWTRQDPDWLRSNLGVTGNDGTLREQFKSMLFSHGHQGLWTAELLKAVFEAIGFVNVQIKNAGDSDHPDLKDIEQHWRSVGKPAAWAESSCVEGMKGRNKPMRVWVFSYCYNEAEMIVWYLRHYSTFASQIHVWDDHSTDGTREILQAHPKVVLHDWPSPGFMDEEINLSLANQSYPMAVGKADWVLWSDIDEIVYHPNILEYLSEQKELGRDVLYTWGFHMLAENGPPSDDGYSQIWERLTTGIPSSIYSKPIVFQPHVKVRWVRGKHQLEGQHLFPERKNLKTSPVPQAHKSHDWEMKLLHYRYLGVEYTRQRNRRNFARLNPLQKGAGWSCMDTWHGEGSPDWVEKMLPYRYNVVDNNAIYEQSCFLA